MQIIEVFDEFEQLLCPLLNILDGYVPVLVKIETHPVLLQNDSDILVVLCEVLPQLCLVLEDHLHQEGQHVRRTIVNHVKMALKGRVEVIIEETIQLN